MTQHPLSVPDPACGQNRSCVSSSGLLPPASHHTPGFRAPETPSPRGKLGHLFLSSPQRSTDPSPKPSPPRQLGLWESQGRSQPARCWAQAPLSALDQRTECEGEPGQLVPQKTGERSQRVGSKAVAQPAWFQLYLTSCKLVPTAMPPGGTAAAVGAKGRLRSEVSRPTAHSLLLLGLAWRGGHLVTPADPADGRVHHGVWADPWGNRLPMPLLGKSCRHQTRQSLNELSYHAVTCMQA